MRELPAEQLERERGSVTAKVTPLSPVCMKVDVEFPWAHVADRLNDTYARLQKRAKVKGFRPGKAPRKVIEQVYRERVESDVVSSLVEEGLVSALRDNHLSPVAQPRVVLPELTSGQPMAFSAEVEVRPKIEKIHFEGLSLTKRVYPVDGSQLTQALEDIRQRAATYEDVNPPRPAARGDVVVANYRVVVDGVARDDMAAKARSISLEEGALLPELEAGLVGKAAGEQSTVSLVFPKDYWQTALREKNAVFEIEVLTVREKRVPEMDDALAKKMGFDSLDALRERIKMQLEETSRSRTEQELKEQIVNQVVAQNEVPIPPSMLASQKASLMREYTQLLHMSGQSLDDLNRPEVIESFDKRAERQVRASLLFTEIAQQYALRVSAEDIDAEVARIAKQSGKHLAKVRVEYQQEDRAERLAAKLLEDKITAKILESATIKEETVSESAG